MKAQAQTAPRTTPSLLHSLFVENLGIKLVSLAVAVALAVFVRGEKTALVEFKMKVQYTLDDDRLLTSPPQGEIIVRLKGAETLLNNLAEDGLPILRVDLADQQSGQLCFKLRNDQLPIGYHSLQIEELLPKCVPLTLEKRIEKEVMVVADITGTPEAGYSLGVISVTPDKVTITGAESAVSEVTQVKTEPISISGVTTDNKTTALLQPFPEKTHVWYKNGTPPQISVNIALTPQKIEKTLGGVQVILNPASVGNQYKQLSDTLDVVVYGPKPVVDAIDPKLLSIQINIEEILKATAPKTIATLRVDTTQLNGLPNDVLPVSFRPDAEIKIYIQEAPKQIPTP